MVPVINIETSKGQVVGEIMKENNLTYKVKVTNGDDVKYFKIRKRDSRIIKN